MKSTTINRNMWDSNREFTFKNAHKIALTIFIYRTKQATARNDDDDYIFGLISRLNVFA